MDHEKALSIISRAWGRQSGYCFFPWISGKATDREERIQSYNEGPAFKWPKDKPRILEHLAKHEIDDLYWCPSLFETPKRRLEQAMDEHALWADLDRIKPDELDQYPPTIAWETSPGRYQALWLVIGDIQGASWPGRENQCMTYYIGADLGGWDTTQLLRIPGWKNHKPQYVQQFGEAPEGKLLWANGRMYLPDDFTELPDVPATSVISEVLEDEVLRTDRHEVWARVRLKVTKRVRELVAAPEASGDRSNVLWEIERELADVGCTLVEIVAIVKATVWNKYQGRADEFKRLSTEASKALALRTDVTKKRIEEESYQRPLPTNLFELLKNLPIPKWIVKDIFTEGTCGFIAGQPKAYKSYCSLDLALSVATGTPFLDHFEVVNPGPVLWIQEEDPPALVKQRLDKIYPSKMLDKVISEEGQLFWTPAKEIKENPPVDAYIGQSFTISDGGWQSWLDEVLDHGGYRLCVLDPLMMIAGDVEENRAQQMTEKIFKPLKQLSRKYNVAMILVHHMRKSDDRFPKRGGQLMLGSVANHAWGEDSLYLSRGKPGIIYVEQESKSSTSRGFQITNLNNLRWEPHIVLPKKDDEPPGENPKVVRKAAPKKTKTRGTKRPGKGPGVLAGLTSLGDGAHAATRIQEVTGLKSNTVGIQLKRLVEQGKVEKKGNLWQLK